MPFAPELRAFTNRNLEALPPEVAARLCAAMKGDRFRATVFEVIVARALNIPGAQSLIYEAATTSGRRPDLTVRSNRRRKRRERLFAKTLADEDDVREHEGSHRSPYSVRGQAVSEADTNR